MEPNWTVTPEEKTIIDQIVARAGAMFPEWDKTDIAMDVVATHNHACRLRLADLLAADDFNFAHDIIGIAFKLDREDLVLKDCFWPRFAAPDAEQRKPIVIPTRDLIIQRIYDAHERIQQTSFRDHIIGREKLEAHLSGQSESTLAAIERFYDALLTDAD